MQQQWASKLCGHDFIVEYRSGVTNLVVDALSRQSDGEINAISTPVPNWVDELKKEHASDSHVQDLLHKLKEGKVDPTQFTNKEGLLFFKGRFIYRPPPLSK